MTANISNNLISQLKPSTKQYDVRDGRLKGFMVRVNPSGKMNYICEYKRGKRIYLGAVGVLSPNQARDLAKKVLGDATQGIDPSTPKKESRTIKLKEFIDDKYKPWAEAHRKAGTDAVARIKRCFYKIFGDLPLDKITPLAIDQWRTNKLKTGRSTQTINRDVATFKAAISKAVEWEYIETNPISKLKLFKVDTASKIRYLTKDEETRIRQTLNEREQRLIINRSHANEWRQERSYDLMPDLSQEHFANYLKPMFLLSVNTGMRQGELFSLDWENIDFSRKILTIAGDVAKSGKTRHIPLNHEAFDTLIKWHEQSPQQGLVFPSKATKKFNNIHKAWHNVLKIAQVENFRWHDIRHHFASRLVMVGVDLNTVRELLGHSDIKMTLRYAHLAPEHKAAAVAKLDILQKKDTTPTKSIHHPPNFQT